MARHEKPIAIYGAAAANLAIAATKITVALLSGSSAMISEGVHSLVDTGNQLLLLFGIHRSRLPPDEGHPFGHGKELYFWSLIVAIVLFGLGGGVSIYEGMVHLRHPRVVTDPTWIYVVLAASFVFESASWALAFREVRPAVEEQGFWRAARTSKDPSVLTVLFEDSAALAGLVVAFAGVFLAQRLGDPRPDGIASLVIGAMLAAVALFLSFQSRSLLLGAAASPAVVESVRRLARDQPSIEDAGAALTMHLGPDDVLLALTLRFRPQVTAAEVARAIEGLEAAIQARHPEVRRIFVDVEALRSAEGSRPAAGTA